MSYGCPVKKNSGFSLIELMITLAVIGILAAIAYPAYLDQVRKSRRADAQAALMNIAARQQQMMLDTRNYAATPSALNVAVPNSVQQAYAVTITVGTATVPSFTATATPSGSQALDRCGVLTLDQTGAKSPTNCW